MDFRFFGASVKDLFGFTLDGDQHKSGKIKSVKGGRVRFETDLSSPLNYAYENDPIAGQVFSPKGVNSTHPQSFVSPDPMDGAMTYEYGYGVGGNHVSALNFDAVYRSENQLIDHYRRMSLYPECDSAIDDIVNAMFVKERNKKLVGLDLSHISISQNLKNKIHDNFNHILRLYDFRNRYYQLVRRWYVDGRMYHHMIIDPENPTGGLIELRMIDPKKIRKLRGNRKVIDIRTGTPVVSQSDEYYLFNPLAGSGNLTDDTLKGYPITADSISFIHSGIPDPSHTSIVSHLHKAIRTMNQLKMSEDAVVIYRYTRAPERLVFKVETGELPPTRKEQFMRQLMNDYKSRVVYNPETGEMGDDRRYAIMQENYWFPMVDGKGYDVDQLPGGMQLGEVSDVDYFLRQLYKSLNVPVSRLDPNSGFNLGRSAEISRDETKFDYFINRLRDDFSAAFYNPLKVQLILKGIISEEAWEEMRHDIHLDHQADSYFSEIKETEMMRERIQNAELAEQFVGRYYSHNTIRKEILKQTDEEIKRIDDENRSVKAAGMFTVQAGKVVSNFDDPAEEEEIKDLDGDGVIEPWEVDAQGDRKLEKEKEIVFKDKGYIPPTVQQGRVDRGNKKINRVEKETQEVKIKEPEEKVEPKSSNEKGKKYKYNNKSKKPQKKKNEEQPRTVRTITSGKVKVLNFKKSEDE